MKAAPLGWPGIIRLGLVQTALGAIVVLMTSTINRVMVVELALPAIVPGLLVASHYAIQILRPAWGYGADVGGRRTPWIIGGLATLAIGGVGAALGTALTATNPVAGLALAGLAFLLVGVGAGAAGTSVLAMLATRVAPQRRAAAATTVWVMMILGFAVSAPIAGHYLDPFSQQRLIVVTAAVCGIAFCVATLAVIGLETDAPAPVSAHQKPPFRDAFTQVWREPAARQFTIFIFVSMLAYSMQELLVEPFAGVVFSMTPGTTTKLAGLQHGGVLLGMIGVALAATAIGGPRLGSLRMWTVGGCLASSAALIAVAASGYVGLASGLRVSVFALGVANGAFAVAAIGSMMGLAAAGANSREGTRVGLWGAAQAIAFGCGGVFATMLVDIAKLVLGAPLSAYAIVFVGEAGLFILSALLASRIASPQTARATVAMPAHVATAQS
ncbi:BCD family MFS transporter [Methylocystis echinoides]|uniref:Bacteriochlorophyll synthase n=1 Tax=Methylocystis echinoides TaxID=29468 RepID=A0A9W6GXN1_9HYPH|nr:BCD family MFS transporter [Methylocystis echinoides]GLI94848.1 bacteriochlorophyll synthase [Methylocystis echinoides]